MAKMDIFGMKVSVLAVAAACLFILHTTQEVGGEYFVVS